jgi:hypothetical protein
MRNGSLRLLSLCGFENGGGPRKAFSEAWRNLSGRCVIPSFYPRSFPAFRPGGCQGIGHAGKNMPCPSSTMSSGRLFLDRVARQHCPSPLHRRLQNIMQFPRPLVKHDISTLPRGRHFYFALTGQFSHLLCSTRL